MAEENRGLTGTLEMRGIGLRLRLGVHAFERIEPRRIPVDLTYRGPLFPLVDYSAVCSHIGNSLEDEYLHIEELARDILTLVKSKWPGNWTVTVRKVQPPVEPPMAEASVTIEG